MALTQAAVLAFSLACAPGQDPALFAGLAQIESGFRANIVSQPNRNGTVDHGLMGINSVNLARLGLTPATALDPCRSIKAASTMLDGPYPPEVVEAAIKLIGRLRAYNPGDPTYPARALATVASIKARLANREPTHPPASSH